MWINIFFNNSDPRVTVITVNILFYHSLNLNFTSEGYRVSRDLETNQWAIWILVYSLRIQA